MKGVISVSLDIDLISQIDNERGKTPRSTRIAQLITNAYSDERKHAAAGTQ